MGTQIGIFPFSGKVDNAVGMKGEDGKSYFRKLVTPKNPNTPGQIDARVKMSLAGQLSKITPKSAIFGMGATARKRRANFTGNIARNAETSTVDGVTTARLAPADLKFSDGVGRDISSVLTAAFANNVLTVTASEMPENIDAIVVVGVFSHDRTGNYNAVDVKTITRTNLSVTMNSTEQVANVYYIPVLQSEGASRASYERAIANIEATNSYSTQAEVLTSGVFDYAASQYLQSVSQGS